MSELYPIFLKLEGELAVVVGGGPVASRRTEGLVRAGADVTVVSPTLTSELEELARRGRIRHIARRLRPADLRGARVVIVAAGDREAVRTARALRATEGFLLGVADDERESDFHVPAVAELPPVKVAVSTAGRSPAAAAEIRDAIAGWLDAHGRSIRERLASGRGAIATTRASARPGWVYLVGAGPGRPDLLTVRARDLLMSADVVFHDRLVPPDVLDAAGPRPERIYVGKEVGVACRANIEGLLVAAARAGRAVVRLKGGDPMVFGRGGEEMLALRRAGIPFEVVPGVSALTGVPAAAHIPITFRGVASELVVRSGHRLGDEAAGAARSDVETTYVYFMAMARLAGVVDELLAEGVSATTPAAVVQNGMRPDQRQVSAELGDICAAAADAGLGPPALLIVGNVVLFRELDLFSSSPMHGRDDAEPVAGRHESEPDGARGTR